MLTLNNDCLASVTAVPDLFLEQYMPAANGEFVKVYLYLLKLVKDHQQDSTLSSMADFFSCTENDIVRALKYWEKQGILSLSYTAGESVPTGIAFLPLVRKEESGILPTPESSISGPIAAAPAVSAVSVEIPQTEQTPAPSPQPAVSAPSASSPADDLSSSGISGQSAEKKLAPGSREELQHVLYVAQTYFGHLLSPTEIECIMFFYDDLHFSADLLEYLVEYCVSKGSTSIHYLKKVGLAWQESGIRDVASAKQETTTFNKHYYTILKAFGIRNRAPVEKEAEMMDRWLNTYGFRLILSRKPVSAPFPRSASRASSTRKAFSPNGRNRASAPWQTSNSAMRSTRKGRKPHLIRMRHEKPLLLLQVTASTISIRENTTTRS